MWKTFTKTVILKVLSNSWDILEMHTQIHMLANP